MDASTPDKAADWLNDHGHLGRVGRDEARQLLMIVETGGVREFDFDS